MGENLGLAEGPLKAGDLLDPNSLRLVLHVPSSANQHGRDASGGRETCTAPGWTLCSPESLWDCGAAESGKKNYSFPNCTSCGPAILGCRRDTQNLSVCSRTGAVEGNAAVWESVNRRNNPRNCLLWKNFAFGPILPAPPMLSVCGWCLLFIKA